MKKILIILISGLVLFGCDTKKGEVINLEENISVFEEITGKEVHIKREEIPMKRNVVSRIIITKASDVPKDMKKTTKKAENKVQARKKAQAQKLQQEKQKQRQQQQTNVKPVSYNKSELQNYAHDLVISYGWSEYDYQCLVNLWNRESGWSPNAVNKSSGACGIPQSLPCNKMASEGADYRTNGKTQIRWGLKYIKNRYGSPSQAWAHSQQKGWY